MTAMDRFERILPAALTDLADPRTPDYLADVLGQTAGTRQRHAWASLERWLPMTAITATRQVRTAPWRQIGLLAILVLALAGALAVYIGTQPRLPEPFGPAANGAIAYDAGGSLYLFDPDTDTVRALVSDAEGWIDPWFSPDGRQLLVANELTPSTVVFGVVPIEGGPIRQITPELAEADWIEWSPTGDALIFTSKVRKVDGNATTFAQEAAIAEVATGTLATIPTEGDASYATYLPPTGERILVVSETGSGGTQIVEMNVDGSGRKTHLEIGPTQQFAGRPSVSSDDSALTYALWDHEAQHGTLQLLDLATGDVRVLVDDPKTSYFVGPRFSPDGTQIAVERITTGPDGDQVHAVVVDVAKGSYIDADVDFAHGGPMEWSPDGTLVVLSPRDGPFGSVQPHVLMDPNTGRVTPAPWTAVSYPSWQRLAP